MSKETRQRIKSVIEMSNYSPNTMAQALKAKRSRQIGVVISDIASPYSSAIIRGIDDVLLKEGYMSLIVDCRNSFELEQRQIKSLLSRNVDGLIINTCGTDNPSLIQLACQGLPIVLCDRRINDYNFAFVGSDTDERIYELVRHLKGQGYGRIALFTENPAVSSVRAERINQFKNAMGVFFPHLDVSNLIYQISLDMPERTRQYLKELLDTTSADLEVPAVFAVSTFTMLHILAEINHLGLSIPDEMGICGPYDWDWGVQFDITQSLQIPLTTIHRNAIQTGSAAAELLLEQINTPGIPKKQLQIPTNLDIRESTLLHPGGGAGCTLDKKHRHQDAVSGR